MQFAALNINDHGWSTPDFICNRNRTQAQVGVEPLMTMRYCCFTWLKRQAENCNLRVFEQHFMVWFVCYVNGCCGIFLRLYGCA